MTKCLMRTREKKKIPFEKSVVLCFYVMVRHSEQNMAHQADRS